MNKSQKIALSRVMDKLNLSQMQAVKGGIDGGISAEDDWETPVV